MSSRENSKTKIPYPSTSSEYKKVYARLKAGNTLEEALKDMDVHRVGGPRGGTQPKYLKAKLTPVSRGTVPAADLLNHPDVPDRVKEAIRVSTEAVQEAAAKIEYFPASTGPKDPPTPVSATDNTDALIKEMGKQTIFLGKIARAMEQIAERLAPQPGQEGTLTLQASHQVPVQPPMRVTDTGLIVGDRVQRHGTTEVGQVVRILPGKRDVDVMFRDGKRTLLTSELTLLQSQGKASA